MRNRFAIDTLFSLTASRHPIQGVASVAVDSREVKPGDLFFALKGARVDGHDYLPEVEARGAVAAVVQDGYCCGQVPDWSSLVPVQ